MHSSNPVLSRSKEFTRGGYATFDTSRTSPQQLEDMYAAPSATAVQTGRMTLDDVVMRTASVFGVLLLTAALAYLLQPGFGLVIGAALVGFGLAMVVSFSKTVRPGLILAYGAVEGVFVGGISAVYAGAFGGNVVPQAVLGTLAAFVAMLVAYRSGAIRNTPKFRRVLITATIGYLIFGVAHFLGVMFGAWDSIYFGAGGPSLLAIGLSLLGVTLASLFLILDFDFIDQGIRNGLPQQYAWTAAFGLVVTLVWLYLEMLRLVAILQGRE
jgi:uncharacterized YccA/Bax inhibitor family protein